MMFYAPLPEERLLRHQSIPRALVLPSVTHAAATATTALMISRYYVTADILSASRR